MRVSFSGAIIFSVKRIAIEKSLKRTIVFIDAANVIYSLKDLGWKIDYKKVQKFFRTKTNLVDIYFYIAYFDEDVGKKSLLEMLSRKGFKIRSKEVKEIKTADGIIHKGNCDVELTMDAMSLVRSFDTTIMMSGDSDFAPLIIFLKSQGKKVITVSTRGHISKELIEVSDSFLYFDLFKKYWEMERKISENQRTSPKRGSR